MNWGGPGGWSQDTGRAAGRSMRARGGRARGEREILDLGGACQRAAQVISGIGVGAGKAGAAETQHLSDLVDRNTTAQQALRDPQIRDTPIRRRETLGDAQAVQPAGVNAAGAGRCQRAVLENGTLWSRRGPDRQALPWGVRRDEIPGRGDEARLCVQQDDPRRKPTGLATSGFLVGESSQPSAMAPIGAGPVCAVQDRQMSGERGGHNGLQRSRADTDPDLEMTGAGAQHDRGFVSVSAHGIDDLVVSVIQIDENIAGVAVARKGVNQDVVALAIAEPQKSDHGVAGELHGGEHPFSREGLPRAAMNESDLIIIARHRRQLSAHGLQREEESAIHDRDSNIDSGTARLKAEVLTLQKSGSFHFALTLNCYSVDTGIAEH